MRSLRLGIIGTGIAARMLHWPALNELADCFQKAFPISGPASFVNEFKDFYAALVQGTAPLMTADDALRDLRVVLAAHRSSLNNEVVFLD